MYLCVSRDSQSEERLLSSTGLNFWSFQCRRGLFPVKYELNFYVLIRLNSCFKGPISFKRVFKAPATGTNFLMLIPSLSQTKPIHIKVGLLHKYAKAFRDISIRFALKKSLVYSKSKTRLVTGNTGHELTQK